MNFSGLSTCVLKRCMKPEFVVISVGGSGNSCFGDLAVALVLRDKRTLS